jgi:hypothetical protein
LDFPAVGCLYAGWLRLSVKSARGRLFRRRGSMLVARFVFAPDGQQILMKKIERIRGYLRTPLVDFFFFPMAVEPQGGVG